MLLQPSVSVQSQVINGLHKIIDAIVNWAIPLAAIGSVSMALLQTIKNQTPIRNWYQRFRVRKWLRASIRGDFSESTLTRFLNGVKIQFSGEKKAREHERSLVNEVERNLISLATSGDKDAFYDLPIESLCDQIRKIVSIILDYPASHERLLRCLARGASSEDFKLLLAAEANSTDPGVQSKEAATAAYRRIAGAKSRILSQVRCSVDAIQIVIAFRWKLWLQVASMILSAVLGFITIHSKLFGTNSDATDNTSTVGSSILIGFLAGFLAPIARDLLAAIEQSPIPK
jgi:hypothetical protein